MSHSVEITLIADQVIEIMGEPVNVHDLKSIGLNDQGEIIEYTKLSTVEATAITNWDREEFFASGCPFCQGKEFLEGPHGGLSINFKCKDCGAIFNDEWVFGIELIEKGNRE